MMKQTIINHLEKIKDDLYSSSTALCHGESNQEWMPKIQLMLEKQGFEIIQEQIDDDKRFKARINGGRGPIIGFFIVDPDHHDELEVWKSCVSNSISIGAALGVASIINEIGGGIKIFNYPRDQEALIIEDQELKEVDAGILLKAGDKTRESSHSIYVNHLRITFRAKEDSLPFSTSRANAL